MQTIKTLLKSCRAIALVLVFLIAFSGCTSSQATPTSAPAEVVTQVVTREVTRIVEVFVTATPAPTLEPTSTPDPSVTTSPALPQAALLQYADCLHGPATFYTYKTSFPVGQQVEVLGRSEDGGWIEIEEVGGWNSCWIQASQAQLQSGRIEDLPVVAPMLPRSEYEYGPPLNTTARRQGDEVTISWEAVYMSADEVQGYLIDAYVCQDGQYLHLPVFVAKTYAENTGTISVKITDEAGCTELSRAHIVSMGTRGFAGREKIFWPAP